MQLSKNRKLTKALIIAVVILWAAVIIKIVFVNSGPAPKAIEAKTTLPTKPTLNISYEKELKIVNKDPFRMRKTHIAQSSKKYVAQPKKELLGIQYLGYTQKTSTGKILANIKYDNTFAVKSENETIGDFQLLRVLEDSILIRYAGQKYYISKVQ